MNPRAPRGDGDEESGTKGPVSGRRGGVTAARKCLGLVDLPELETLDVRRGSDRDEGYVSVCGR